LRQEGHSRSERGMLSPRREVVDHLEIAANAVEQTEWQKALGHLIIAWRLVKHPAFAKSVVAIDRLMAPQPIEGETHMKREAAWHAMCAVPDETVVPVLLATPWPRSAKAMLARVVALGRREPSPRISHSLVSLYDGSAARGPSFARLARGIFRVLIEQGDPVATRTLLAVKEATGPYAEKSRKDLASFLERELPPMPVLDEACLAALERIKVGNSEWKAKRDLLYEAVYASPFEAGPREVLADALIEIDDPYGEFIQLELGTRHRRQSRARSAELFRVGARRWAGGIDLDGANDINFSRGFPHQASTSIAKFTSPAWATIEELQIIGRCDFVGAPMLTGLRCLYGLYSDELHKITLPRPTQIEDLSVSGYVGLERSLPFAPLRLGIDDVDERVMPSIAKELAAWPIGRTVTAVHTSLTAWSIETAMRILENAPQIEGVILTGRRIRIAKASDWSCMLTRSELFLFCEDPRVENHIGRLVDMLSSARPAISELALVSDGSRRVGAHVHDELARLAARWNVSFEAVSC
jgi:hypothetical protein